MNRKHLLIGACAVAAAVAYILLRPIPTNDVTSSTPPKGSPRVAIHIPPIEGNTAIGQRIFENACVACHGTNAVGVEGAGPPLIHVIYEPSHHADESFQRAVAVGVRSHHWRFGDMPPVEGLTRGDVTMIIAYIREIQRANGIN
ncbi:MAG: cytochrome c [Pelagimonas sp.]|jgi:mono/diheme cytochrome c family protein|nr:cytochrome c [Pelagimonas sp.]